MSTEHIPFYDEFMKWTEQFDEPLDVEGAYRDHLAQSIATDLGHAVVVNNVRVLRTTNPVRVYNEQLVGADSVIQALRQYLLDKEDVEHMFAIVCDQNNYCIHVHHIAQGTVNAVVVDARAIFRAALIMNAVSIIIAHTHPSGNVTPSREDIMLTDRLTQAAKYLDVRILDHIIFNTRTGEYHSMCSSGQL